MTANSFFHRRPIRFEIQLPLLTELRAVTSDRPRGLKSILSNSADHDVIIQKVVYDVMIQEVGFCVYFIYL